MNGGYEFYVIRYLPVDDPVQGVSVRVCPVCGVFPVSEKFLGKYMVKTVPKNTYRLTHLYRKDE